MNSKDLAPRFTDLPQVVQKQLIESTSRIAASAYVAQVGGKATTDVAISHATHALALDGAARAVQRANLPTPTKQRVASEFASTLTAHRDLRDRVERQIRHEISVAASQPGSESCQEAARPSFGNDLMNGLTLGLWGDSKKK